MRIRLWLARHLAPIKVGVIDVAVAIPEPKVVNIVAGYNFNIYYGRTSGKHIRFNNYPLF